MTPPDRRRITWACPACGHAITRLLHAHSRAAVCDFCRQRRNLPESLRLRLQANQVELPGFGEEQEKTI